MATEIGEGTAPHPQSLVGEKGLVPVTQADREAAASVLRGLGHHFYADEVACGEADHAAAAQAFARHRIVETAELYEANREAADFLRAYFGPVSSDDPEAWFHAEARSVCLKLEAALAKARP